MEVMPKRKVTAEVQEGFWYDEPNHLYFYDGKPMTGCTTILNVISKPALVGWASKMACEYIRNNADDQGYLESGKKTGVLLVGPELLEEAQKAHAQKRDKAGDEGTLLHATVETFVKYAIENHDGKPLGAYPDEIKRFVEWAQIENIRFIATEQKLYSKELFVAGTADLIFEKDGKTYIGDLKCKDKIWSREPFFQCAGYGLMHREMNGSDIDGYCVIRMKEETLLKLSAFADKNPEIKELDLNPIFAYRDGLTAVDARVVLEAEAIR